jgi:2-dehydro-3-deoxyphosphooctonate aldolase (KDO 8-P synthase)
MIDVAGIQFGGPKLALIAGPCVIESTQLVLDVARELADICGGLDVPFIFKASFDKANRTSIDSFRGPGLAKGLDVLVRVKSEVGCPVLSDIHEPSQAAPAGEVLDILQIPAFLCRQTDLLVAAGETGVAVNVKKGQFLAPWDMQNAVGKLESTGNRSILLTERGTTFGYNNLVSDMRSIPSMKQLGYPVVFDGTHSVQLPGGQGTASGGQREMVPTLVNAAVAAGADALFLEVHPDPDSGLCDAANMLRLDELASMLTVAKGIHALLGDADR